MLKSLHLLQTKNILANCKTLDPTWKEVVTDPVLPVQHGTEITLSCPVDYTNKGGDKAVCQDGQFVQYGQISVCRGEYRENGAKRLMTKYFIAMT